MARVDQMPYGQRAARHVVDRDRALGGALGDPVDQHEGDAVAAERRDVAPGRVGGRQQHAAYPLLGEERQVVGLLAGALRAVADHHAEPGVPRGALGAAGDVHEEGVAHVEDEQAHDPAASGPQLARGLAADIAEPVYRRLDTGPGLGGDAVRAVDDVRDRAHGDSGGAGDVLDTHRLCHQAGTSRGTRSGGRAFTLPASPPTVLVMRAAGNRRRGEPRAWSRWTSPGT